MQDKILSLLGLACRAGKISSGEFSVEKDVKSGKAFLVVVAGDASAATRKTYGDMCSFYHVPIMYYGDKDCLGHCIGKEFRAAVAVKDEGFANSILKLEEQNGGN